ncbi:hypothetical protein ACUM5Y_02335 [Marinomonas dokdonensis]|uniref:hypothetical protein n=1 Tax=Marinomonas dokdonensis TaxID=328224 RepID=UPI00405599C5
MNQNNTNYNVPRKPLVHTFYKAALLMAVLFAIVMGLSYHQANNQLHQMDIRQKQIADLSLQLNRIEGYLLDIVFAPETSADLTAKTNASFLTALSLVKDRITVYDVLPIADVDELFAFLAAFTEENHDFSDLSAPQRETLNARFHDVKTLLLRLSQESQSLVLQRQQLMKQGWLWLAGLWAVLVVILGLVVSSLRGRLTQGIANLHYIVERHKHKEYRLELDQKIQDEFSDFGLSLAHELTSRDIQLNQQAEQLERIEQAFSVMPLPMLVTNDKGDVEWLSSGFETLWQTNTRELEELLMVDAGLDSIRGESISQELLGMNSKVKLKDGSYTLSVSSLDSKTQACCITLVPHYELAELQVLHKSVMLMTQDIWSAPIRLLRKDSVYYELSVGLEALRIKGVSVLADVNFARENQLGYEEFTKLQQIATYIQAQNIDNESSQQEKMPVVLQQTGESHRDLSEMAELSEQIKDVVLLGYESTLQKLALSEQDRLAHHDLLDEVERCLSEVRLGVLHSLQATENEGELIRQRFSKDLNHDIDTVQERILLMKAKSQESLPLLATDRQISRERLNTAQADVEELLALVHKLLADNNRVDEESDVNGVTLEVTQASEGESL